MKSPHEIVAENLPTFADHYRTAPISLPSQGELLRAARRIIHELELAGYRIVKGTAS